LYDLRTRQEIAQRRMPPESSNSDDYDFSPDDKILARTDVLGKCVQLWSMDTLQPVNQRLDLGEHAEGVSFSPDGKWLATAAGRRYSEGVPGEVRIWDTSTWKVHTRLPGITDSPQRVQFSRDGRWIATSGAGGFVKVWNASSFEKVTKLSGMRRFVLGLCFSPKSDLLAAADSEGMIRLWNTGSWTERLTIAAHPRMIRRIAFSPDGQMLASGSIDHTVKLWRVKDGLLLNTLLGHNGQVTGLSFSPDGTLASSGEDAVILWRPAQKFDPLVFRGHKGLIDVGVGYSPDGRWLAMTTNLVVTNTLGVGTVALRTAILDPATLTIVADVPGHPFVLGPANMLATRTSDSVITLWELSASGAAEKARLVASAKLLPSFAFSPNSTLFAARSATNQIYLWNVQNPSTARIIQRPWAVQDGDILFSANERTLVLGHAPQRALEYWDTTNLRLIRSIDAGHNDTQPLALSPDGRTMAAMGRNHTLWLWDFESHKRLKELRGTREVVKALAFCPDGTSLAAGGSDGALKLYNLVCAREVAALPAHQSVCHAVSFSKDGTRIATAGVDDTIKIWSAPAFQETDRP
jgi:WD40 repeat protein